MAYRIHYSDYSTTASGPPDPERWIGPPGPPGPQGPPGPPSSVVDGGTVTGPLYTTATGGTVARSEQARAADVANVLDYGADPTGVADSAPAINAAAATVNAHGQNKSVYVPSGFYRVDHTINLINGQAFFGDGRGNTRLFCDGNFATTQPAVFLIKSGTQFLDVGPELRGFSITMVQPSGATTRAQMVQYPWVVSCQANCGRVKILHVRISGAWNGFTTGGNNVVFSIWDLELGALNEGLRIGMDGDGPQDFCHIHGLHFWNFDLPMGAYGDGNTVAMRIGRCDSLDCTNFSSWAAQIIIDSANSGSTTTHFTNLQLDGDPASITFLGGLHHHIANVYSSAGTSRTRAALTVNGATVVQVANWYSHNSSAFPMFDVQAGELSIENAQIRHYAHGTPIGQTSTGNALLKVTTATVWTNAGNYTQPLFVQGGGTSRMCISALTVDNLGTVNAGSVVTIASDTLGNMVGPVMAPLGWNVTTPAGAVNTQPTLPVGLRLGGTPSATAGQLTILPSGAVNALESKLRFHGTFPSGADYGQYLAASLRAGWNAFSWTGSYLDVWLTNAGNGAASDANMTRVANFTPGGVTFQVATTAPSAYLGSASSGGTGIQLQTASGNVKNIIFATGAALRWILNTDAAETFRLDRYNASSTYLDTPLAINAGNGAIYHNVLAASTTYANDAAAAAGGVGVGQLYRNGSIVMVRVT